MADSLRSNGRRPRAVGLLTLCAAALLSACAGPVVRDSDADASAVASPASAWQDAQQLVVVTTADWNAKDGQLRRFERTPQGWREVGAATPVSVGRNGSAWGAGLHPAQADGPQKREGDGRAPAGVFAIGTAFGYPARADTALPYQAMGFEDWCIDVPESPLYNRLVDAREVGADAVKGSTEPMRRDLHLQGDQRYRLGFVIDHNPQRTPGAGSCIFAHLWKAPGEATAGCTAMSNAAMDELLAWLGPQRRPVFVLMPRTEYARVQAAWGLPVLGATAR